MPPGQPLRTLKNLGPCSEALLSAAGIDTVEDLKAVGAMGAYLRVIHTQAGAPSLNLLYALVGALENTTWQKMARRDKTRLLLELGDRQTLDALTNPNKPQR